jgi:prepilin-type processing-associated H-X9-DG protein
MYKIIGADQKEYGPVSAEQINQWIAQGRVNAQTKVQAEGGEWKALIDFPEFAASLGNRAATLSPPPAASSLSSQPLNAAKTSALAICSLVFGILGLPTCGILALFGLVFGIIALVRIKNSHGALKGNGLAIAGTIVSGVFLLMLPVWAAMLLPALAKAKQRAQTIQCVNNMRQLALAVRIYSSDHNNQFPPAATWCDTLKSEVGSEKVFKCPAANENDHCDYAFNSAVGGKEEKEIDPNTVLFFETDDNWNANGGKELMIQKWRHGRLCVVAFADGHVEQVNVQRFSTLRWNP